MYAFRDQQKAALAGTSKRRAPGAGEVDVGTAELTPAQRIKRRMKELTLEVRACWGEGLVFAGVRGEGGRVHVP